MDRTPPVFPTPCRVNKEQFFYPLSRLYTGNESICRDFSIRVYIISCGKECQTENGGRFSPFSGPIPGPVRWDNRSDWKKGSLLSGWERLMNRIPGAGAVRFSTPTCDARCRPRTYPRGLRPLTPGQPSGHLVSRVYFRIWRPGGGSVTELVCRYRP
jgi:hypothetical protein